MRQGWDGTRLCWATQCGVSSVGTHLERHSSLKAWIAMRVIFTDIKQKGNCWNGSGTRSVATQVLPFVLRIFYNLA